MLAALALVTCTEEPTSPTRPGVGTLRVGPQFDALARLVPLTLDNVRVIVVRPPSDTILRAARTFSPSNQQLTLNLPVLLLSNREALQVTLELYAGSTLLFTGTTTVQVTAGVSAPPPASVPVSYQGPGATLTAITLTPRDTTVSLGATFPFGATAVDAQQNNVPLFYVSWSADAGSIDAAGVFTAPTARDTLYVHATSPNGVTDSTRVFVTAPPSTLTKTGGDAQTGTIGTRLPLPLAVRVNGSDGQPVVGASVAFTVTTGGGSVDSALATSDAQGIARTGATLGLSVGQQSYTATVSGIPSAVFTATATGVAPVVTTLSAGGNTSCEIRSGQTLCWGANGSGQLGDGTTADRAVPGPISGGFGFTTVTVGSTHACALTAAGQAFCWGDNSLGALGDGTTTSRLTPTAVLGGQSFVQLVAGMGVTCGLTSTGQAFCWGSNNLGELGDGTTTDRTIPTAVSGGFVFTMIATNGDHSCGLTAQGQARCWGGNLNGELGDGTQTNRTAPTLVTGGLSFTALTTGLSSSCGLDGSGAGYCWGLNFGIQLTSPQPVAGGFTYTALGENGDNHICALTSGVWRCGGDNGFGQLGDGTTIDRPAPVVPTGGFSFTAIAAGAGHTCGRTSTSTQCWGSNSNGQLGNGTTVDQLTPTASVGPATTAAVSAGNGQTATAGTAVPVAPAIVVRDAFSNPVRGLGVVFAVTGGGGSLTGAVTQTDAAGIATVGSWTLGATAGANTLSATVQVGGLSGNPVSFTATGAAPSAVTWNGSASTAWTDPNNWTPNVVPGSAQDVLIPSGPSNMPVLGTTATVASLTLQGSAALTLLNNITLTVNGDLDDAGNLTSGGGTQTVVLAGTGRTVRHTPIPVPVSVTGSYTLNGTATVANALSISGSSASLTVGGQALIVNSLTVGSGGSLFMTNVADVVVVGGNLTMGGSDHTGKLTAGQIQVQGNFVQTSAGSPNSFVATGSHAVIMTGAGSTIAFQSPGSSASRFNRLLFGVGAFTGATASLGSRVVVGENAFINSGSLSLAGHTLEVVADFVVLPSAGSRLTMTNTLDSLLIGGNASFDGESELTFMSAGVMVLAGNLTQQNTISGDAFHPSGSHKTVLTGASPALSFATPGNVPGSSHFETVEWSGTGTLTLASDVFAHGPFQSLGAGTSTLASINHVLDVGGFSAAGPVTFSGTALRLNMPSGGSLALGNLTFQSMSSTVNQFEVLHPGTGGPFSFTNFTFSSVPTSGRYLVATDADGGTPVALTIDMVNPAPATDGGFKLEANGAVINWPAAVPIITWNGSASSSWTTPSNWTPAIVPTATDDVLIPSGLGTYPVLAAGITVRDLVLQAGASLNQSNQSITAGGDVDMSGALTGTGAFTMNGTAVTARGSFPNVLNITGTVTVTGPLTATNQLNVTAGDLALNGNTVTTGGFNTTGSGTVTLTNPIDTLRVTTTGATFRGGNTNGKLTAGVVRISGGGFDSQLGPSAFVSTGTRLLFDGSANQSVANNVGGNSYADVIVNKSGGNFIWAGGAAIGGLFEVLSPTAVTGTQTLQARRIITAAGSSLGVSAITVNSDSLSVGGSFSVAQVNFTAGSTLPVLPYAGLLLQHPSPQAITAAGDITATSFITVGSFSELVLGGHTMTVTGPFALGGGASLLTMTNPLDSLKVTGDANFSGGNLNGRLTAGAIRVTGNLVFGNLGIFTSTGTRLVLEGGATQVMNNQAGATAFSDLEVAKTGGVVNLGGTFAVNLSGRLLTTAGGTNVLTNGTMNAAGADVDGLTLDNIAFTLGNGSIAKFDNVSFTNYPTTATQLIVNNTGAAGALTFSNLSFSVVPTTGLYLRANDTDGATSGVLTVNLVNPTPATDGGFKQELNGAVINWPAAVPSLTWTGAVDTDWSAAGNWSPAQVPTGSADVTIPSGTANSPLVAITTSASARDLHVAPGATLTVNGGLDVNGLMDGSGTITGSGGVRLMGTGQTAHGTFSTLDVGPGASYSASGAIQTTGDLTLNSGTLTVAGQLITVGNDLRVFGSGLLVMQNPGDQVLVSNQATFAGAASAGFLTDGTLTVTGKFSQAIVASSASFSASGNHTTVLNGTAFQQVDFQTPGAGTGLSHFANLDASTHTSGGVDFTRANTVVVEGQLIVLPATGLVQFFTSNGGQLSVGGVNVHDLGLNDLPLTITGGSITQFNRVTFGGFQGNEIQLTVDHPGGASPFVFDALTFQDIPTTGLYLRAIDTDNQAPFLTLDLTNPSPATDGGFSQAVNGAVINWPPAVPAAIWTGTVSSNWHTPGNWNTGSVPTVATDVTIPAGTPNAPVLSAPGVVQALRVQTGATVDLGGFPLTVASVLDVSGSVIGAAGSVIVTTGPNTVMQGAIGVDLTIAGIAGLGGPFTVGGSLLVQDLLNLNGTSLSVTGDLTTQGAAALIRMANGGEFLQVQGNATFDGGDQLGFMTTGTLELWGNFTQLNTHSGDSFHPSGGHVTNLLGTAPTLTFATPGDVPGTSHFQFLAWGNTGTLTLASDVYAHNALTFGSFGGNTVISGGNQLSVGRVVMANGATVTFDNTRLVINSPSAALPIGFDHVTFQNMDPTVTQLTVLHTGTGGPYTFSDFTFSTTPTGGGLYLQATDADGGTPLTINMVNPNPATDGGFSQAVNGAVINWPATGAIITWSGSASTDWFTPANWVGGVVPSTFDNVIIGPAANQPVLTNNAAVNDLTVQAGATLELGDFVLVAGGNVDATGTVDDLTGTGNAGVTLTGFGTTYSGALLTTVAVNGSATLAGPLTTGDMALLGTLVIAGQTLNVQGILTVSSVNGLLDMENTLDQVNVTGDAFFDGASSAGRLTAGTLTIGGDFIQFASHSAQSFAADPGHLTVLSASPASITFATPGANGSHFGDLAEAGFGATFNLSSDVTILGNLSGGDGFGGTMVGLSCPSVLTLRSYSTSGPLTLDCVQLVIDDPSGSNTFLNGVSFSNLPTSVTQLTIQHPGVSTGNLGFNFMTFVPLTTGDTGFYVSGVETSPGAPNLVIDFLSGGANVANGPSFTTTSGGASVLWP